MNSHPLRAIGTLGLVLLIVAPGLQGAFTPRVFATDHPTSSNPSTFQPGTSYAVICACSQYNDPRYNIPKGMPAPESKLRVLHDALAQAPTWNATHMVLLLNHNATRQAIIGALQQMAAVMTENDTFIFSWNGHGSAVPDADGDESHGDPEDTFDEVICPYDIAEENGTLVNCITDDELGTLCADIHAKGKLLIFESCLSGGLVGGNETGAQTCVREDQTAYTMDVNDDKTVVVMSTLPSTLGRATFMSHCPLISSMAQVIINRERFDRNSDSFLSAEEMFFYARPMAMKQSALLWVYEWCYLFSFFKFDWYHIYTFSTWFFDYFDTLDALMPIPWILASMLTVVGFLIQEMMMKNLHGYYVLNWPNIRDDVPGDLLVVPL